MAPGVEGDDRDREEVSQLVDAEQLSEWLELMASFAGFHAVS
jgi:hypothetical protein